MLIILLVVVGLGLAFTLTGATESLRGYASVEPPDKTYGYDAVVYLKAFYRMNEGQNFYMAYANAVVADSRVNYLTADSWDGPNNNPVLVRQPWIFYIWKLIAQNGAWVVTMSIMLALVCAGSVVLTLGSRYGPQAGATTLMLIVPYIFMGGSWVNVFFPDWWAGLIILPAIGALLKQKYVFSAGLGFLAGIIRESLLIFTVAATVGAIIKRDFKAALAYGISSLAIIAVFAAHYVIGNNLLPGIRNSSIPRFTFGIQWPFLTSATSYLMFPYGYFIFPTLLIAIVAIVACLRLKDKQAGYSMAIFFTLLLAYTGLFNSAGYWGQVFMPGALVLLPTLFWRADTNSSTTQ